MSSGFHSAVSGLFQLQPLNSAVLQGSVARFNATVQGNWTLMTWMFQGILVLSIFSKGNVTSFKERFSAIFCSSSSDGSCVEFSIYNVSRNESGPVTCTVLGGRSETAHLEVQAQDRRALQLVIKTAQNIIGTHLPGIIDVSEKRDLCRARRILKDNTHPRNSLFTLLPSGKNYRKRGTVNITGENVTVMQGQQVEFRCVTSAWYPTPTVSWTRNGQAVNSSLYNTSSMADGDTFNSTSVLKFQAESNTTVECRATVQALTNPESSSVFLVVATVPKPPDWTVLIAVVLSFGGSALLVLLIIGIVFCYKRRKEKQTNYQDEMSKRVKTQSPLSVVNAAEQRVYENTGYVSDCQTSVAPREHTDSGFWQPIGSNVNEVPGYSIQVANDYNNTVDQSGFRKHRHVTIV
ncbi:immunoglobulin superfamily member 5 [Sander vitreus]